MQIFTSITSATSYPGECLILSQTAWDDMFKYQTEFIANYRDTRGTITKLGTTKVASYDLQPGSAIGLTERGEPVRSVVLFDGVEDLPDTCYSLGQSPEFYVACMNLGRDVAVRILSAMRDVAFNKELRDRVSLQDPYLVSLRRFVDKRDIEEQFERILDNGPKLRQFQLAYTVSFESLGEYPLEFRVEPDSDLPLNIHALIGRNGAGKTSILKAILMHELGAEVSEPGPEGDYWPRWQRDPIEVRRDDRDQNSVRRVVYVAFSHFDTIVRDNERIVERRLVDNSFRYVGTRDIHQVEYRHHDDKYGTLREETGYFPGTAQANRPYDPLEALSETKGDWLNGQKLRAYIVALFESAMNERNIDLYLSTMELLSSDPKFRSLGLSGLTVDPSDWEQASDPGALIKWWVENKFDDLSSGHKNILMSALGIIVNVTEEAIVLLDEPEGHLHPPLLSAFIRALSVILKARNGLAIIATHSPVILQEIPSNCAWIINAEEKAVEIKRPPIQTFGENVGILTSEVFGLEVQRSGYTQYLREALRRYGSADAVMELIGQQMSLQAKVVLRSLEANA